MGYTEVLTSTPYFWIGLSAVSTGAALAALTRALVPGRRRRNRSGEITRFYIYLSVAIACLPAAVFIPGPDLIRDPGLPGFFAAVTAAAAAGFRFKSFIGVPLLLVLGIMVSLSGPVFSRWEPFGRTVDGLQIRILSDTGDRIVLDLEGAHHDLPLVTQLQGNTFSVELEQISIHPAWFILGRRDGYRLVSLTGYHLRAEDTERQYRATGDRLRLEYPEAGPVVDRIREYLEHVPGVRFTSVSAGPVTAGTLQVFVLRILGESGKISGINLVREQ